MHVCLLLGCLALISTSCFLVSTHMIPEDDGLSTNKNTSSNPLSARQYLDSPSIVIVELPKERKNKTSKKQKKQNKLGIKKKQLLPPPNCVSLWGSCKSPENVCCDHCAFCQCRLFKTVCFCRMGNPGC